MTNGLKYRGEKDRDVSGRNRVGLTASREEGMSKDHDVSVARAARLTSNPRAILALVGWFLILAAAAGNLEVARAQQTPAAGPARAKGRAITDRYPLKYPPTLIGGGTSAVEETAEFLKPGPNLGDGVEIARTPPRVEFSFYPEQNYPGNPWSHRSDGFVKGDKYYSSSNDHLAPRGTAHLWEYDALSRKFRLLCDTTKFLESAGAFPESMNYRPGEMQSRVDMGSDGWLYYATDRGSPTATHDGNGYLGEWILRTNPRTLKTEIVVTHPIAKHTIPATVLDPLRMILYCGTAPGKDSPNQNVQFFALDLNSRKILKVDEEGGPTRTLIFSPSTGCVFWEGKKYDPRTNEITPANVPHVRSCSQETPQGIVYGTSQTKADLWAYHVKTDELKQLGSAAVGKQEYIASIEADPTGRYLYYVPGAHGGANGDGTPIVQYDTRTGRKKVLAFLHDVFWNKHGYALDGSFGNALDEKGERFFISWDGWRKGQPRGWESAAITVLYIPASERVIERNKQSALIEDDGPAAGFSYQPNEEVLSPDVWIKKELVVEGPTAEKATLLVGRQAGKNGGPLEATINSQTAKLTPAGKAGRAWEAYEIDPKLLKTGKNEIVLRGSGKIWIARDDEYAAGSRERTRHPNRSAKSSDGGRTWDYDHLGPRGDIDGEYYVRLFLHRSQPSTTDETASVKEPSHRLPKNIKVLQSQNQPIVRSSIPFEYEPYDQPQLSELRKKHKLDEVVDGASTEFELICRLAAWSSQQWEKGHLAECYPAWNALEILAPHKDGKPMGGFCQQYNLVFLQACESFGIPGRAVSIDQGALADRIKGSGHEVVEVWSNEYRKWVYVDGNCAWYAIDEESRTPLSLWELRERQLLLLAGKPSPAIKIINLAKTRYTWDGLTSWPPFIELRLIPRSNFLAEKSPLPLNQGMRGWFWTGHYVWHDDAAPATLLYGNRVTRRSDWEWPLNQVHIQLEPLAEQGQVRVLLDTQTPGFDTFVARIDDREPAAVTSGFVWPLHAGRNRLEVRPRNVAGREGIASFVVLEKDAAAEKLPFNFRLVPIVQGNRESSFGDDEARWLTTPVAKAAAACGVDVKTPAHPLVAHSYKNQRLFYLFYNTIDDAVDEKAYVIQRIKRTIKDYAGPDDREPKTTVTHLVEVMKLKNFTFRPDQHFGSFGLGTSHRREIVKECEIGFGEIPGKAEGSVWPFDPKRLFEVVQPQAEAPGLYEKVEFSRSRTWKITAWFDRDGNYAVQSPELGIDAPRQLPDLKDARRPVKELGND